MDANLSNLSYQQETTWGVFPVNPALKTMRITGESLMHEKETVESQEIRDDRQTADVALVGSSAGGAVKFELSYTDFIPWFEAALMGDLVTHNLLIDGADADHTTQIIVGPDGDFSTVIVGGYIRIAGFATPENNGIKKVISKAVDGLSITLDAGSLTASELNRELTITGSQLKNGKTRKSYTFERRVPKAGGFEYQCFAGMMVDKLGLELKSKAIVTGSLTFIGRLGSLASASLNGEETPYLPASSDEVVNATTHVSKIKRGGIAMEERFKAPSYDISNNLRGRDAISEAGNFDVGVGSLKVKGKFESYFKDNSLLAAVINHDYTSLSHWFTDPDGNVIIIELPRVTLNSASSSLDKLDSDVMVPIDFQAIRDEATNATIIMSFIPAA